MATTEIANSDERGGNIANKLIDNRAIGGSEWKKLGVGEEAIADGNYQNIEGYTHQSSA